MYNTELLLAKTEAWWHIGMSSASHTQTVVVGVQILQIYIFMHDRATFVECLHKCIFGSNTVFVSVMFPKLSKAKFKIGPTNFLFPKRSCLKNAPFPKCSCPKNAPFPKRSCHKTPLSQKRSVHKTFLSQNTPVSKTLLSQKRC